MRLSDLSLHCQLSTDRLPPSLSPTAINPRYSGNSSSQLTSAPPSPDGPPTPSSSLASSQDFYRSRAHSSASVQYSLAAMNPPDIFYPHQLSTAPGPQQQTVTSNAMPAHYGHQAAPPPLMQPATQYGAPSQHFPPYNYGLPSPQSATPVSGMGHAPNVLPLPNQNQMQSPHMPPGFDTTGQIAPPGMKPRVTATLWEDEGSLCFQVEARGICVARREDNHMINGTKLLNVAGMTRGRRDGILKSEKVRHVVKIGPMHLKGVWIPFERALDFANKEKITEMLYPLFVHNIGSLLYHPTNQTRTNQVMAAAERHKRENSMRGAPGSAQPSPAALPSIGQHHHHMSMPGPQPALPSHANGHRPSLDRAHTFPTPPTSASSVMGNMGAHENFQWNQGQMNGASQPQNPPRHPADQADVKPPNPIMPHGEAVSHNAGEDEAEHEAEYTHDSGAYNGNRSTYDNRGAYDYNGPQIPSMANDHSLSSADMSGSPTHQTASGRATPRTAAPPQPYYSQAGGYNSPPRVPSSSSVYNVISNDRQPTNGAASGYLYGSQGSMPGHMQTGYASQPVLNAVPGMKRGRDDEDDFSGSAVGMEMKRRKTLVDATSPFDVIPRPTSTVGPHR